MMGRLCSLVLAIGLSAVGLYAVDTALADDVSDPSGCALPIELPSSFQSDSVQQISILPDGRILVRGFAEFYVLNSSTGEIRNAVDLLGHYSRALFSPQYVIPFGTGRVALVTETGIALLDGDRLRLVSDLPIASRPEVIIELPNGDALIQLDGRGVVRLRADGNTEPVDEIRKLVPLSDGRVLGWGFGRLWLYSTDEMQLLLDLTDQNPSEAVWLGPTVEDSGQIIVVGGHPFRITPDNQVRPIPIESGSIEDNDDDALEIVLLKTSGAITAAIVGANVAILQNGIFLIDPFEGRVGPVRSLWPLDGGGFFIEPAFGKAGILDSDGTAQILDPQGKWPTVDWLHVNAFRLPSGQIALLERFYTSSNDGREFDYADMFMVREDGAIERLTDDDRIPFMHIRTLSNGKVLIHSGAGLFEFTPDSELRLIEAGSEFGLAEVLETRDYGVLLGTSEGIFRLEQDLSVVELVRFPENKNGEIDLISTGAGDIWAIDRGALLRINKDCLAL